MRTKRILVIDDEPGITRTIKANLERLGTYSVCTENHASRALETARHFHPDLIFLDVIMPGVDGARLAAQIKSDQELRSVQIVFLTALLAREETSVSGATIAGHFFIAKPANLEALTKCIEKCTTTFDGKGGATRPTKQQTEAVQESCQEIAELRGRDEMFKTVKRTQPNGYSQREARGVAGPVLS